MNLYKDIEKIKNQRINYIDSFDPSKLSEEELINANQNKNLQTIRVHKFLTHNGLIGKVVTARFLTTINLDENSRFIDLNKKQIQSIIEYVNT